VTTLCLQTAAEVALVGELSDSIRVVVWDGAGEPPPNIADVDLFVASYMEPPVPDEALARMSRLRVIQVLSAGVEAWLPRVPPGVMLCNGRGVHGGSTAELAVAGVTSLLRELPRWREAQRAHEWVDAATDGSDGKRVVIIGSGDIGRRIGSALAAFGADVIYVNRSGHDGAHALSELPSLLPDAGVVILALPLTDESRGLVDGRFLAAMPDGAILANIARGKLVDTDALLAQLSSGRLSAFLDVTDPEPLPADHPLWDAPNLLLTPHIGGGTRGWDERAYRLVREQVLRLDAGVPLHNVVVG